MHASPDANEQPHTGAAVIEDDVPCDGCGYNLKTRPMHGVCPECGLAVAYTLQKIRCRGEFPVASRVAYILYGIVLPFACFATLAFVRDLAPFIGPTYRSGRHKELVGLLLTHASCWPFYPLLLYAVLSLGYAAVHPVQAAKAPLVRLGVIGGIVLAGQYVAVVTIAVFGSGAILLLPSILGIALVAYGTARQRMKSRDTGAHGATIALVIPVLAELLALFVTPDFIPIAAMLVLATGPLWALLAFTMMDARLAATADARWSRIGLLAIPWIGTYALAWGVAIRSAIDAYSRLPLTNPGCYVATAAARGHRRLTRAQRLKLPNGQTLLVSPQMRALKAGELALQAVAPRAHRVTRRVYDIVGRWAARWITHPLVADAACLMLWPIEWATRRVLLALVRDADDLIARLYRP